MIPIGPLTPKRGRVLVFWNPKAGTGFGEARVQRLADLLSVQHFETEIISQIDRLLMLRAKCQRCVTPPHATVIPKSQRFPRRATI